MDGSRPSPLSTDRRLRRTSPYRAEIGPFHPRPGSRTPAFVESEFVDPVSRVALL
jgi:hypothetical protein